MFLTLQVDGMMDLGLKEQLANLYIKNKGRSRINLNIHHSKVFSPG